MASFDYDWTLVSSKDGKSYPSNISDWKWLYPNIPQVIKEYHQKGYMIVIFTNQSKSWKHKQIKVVARSLDIPIFIVVATDKRYYKPNTILFNSLIGDKQIDTDSSFYVGDVIGRKTDYSDSDKVFAENIGIRVYSPEEMFRVE
jgi:bifunctional polynucleotide phosphatase/kinase